MIQPSASSTWEHYTFESSCLSCIDYNPSSGRLVVTFTRGSTRYTYYNVPRSIVTALLQADSPGTFFQARIAKHYNR